jgi:glycosyltransferase involved in cell wall biosynthesis
MEHPFISIIIPCKNEEKYIDDCLNAIYASKYEGDFEVIIADGMSTDNTKKIIENFQLKNTNLVIVNNPGLIVPKGMNMALRAAKGEIIIRIDGHTQIAEDYIQYCVDFMMSSEADNVGGRMIAIGETRFGETVAVVTSTPFGIGGSRFHYSDHEELVDSVYMGAWRREVFTRIGLFDEELVRNQDDEFNYRLRKHGGRILLSPKIKSKYTVRGSPKALWKQYFQYGFWKVRVLQKHPLQMSIRHFVPPLFVISLIVFGIISIILPWFWNVFLLVLGSYLVTNLSVSIITAVQKSLKQIFLLPFVFAILHLSYGSGFLCGLIKFYNRWGDKQGKVPELILTYDKPK